MEAKDIVAEEVTRQAEFGMEPSWEDIAIAGREAGIKEVVDWGDEDCPHDTMAGDEALHWSPKRNCDECWQAKLKDWGIK